MRALDRKLFRELRRHWVQITSIALVMGCGTMTIMGLRSTLTSIRAARDDYFDVYRFGDVFAHLERAPDVVAQRIARIRGVGAIETRVVRDVRLDVPGLSEPAIGHMVSIPAVRRSMLNELLIRRGRWIAPGSPREVLVSDRFAEVNHLAPGDSLSAVINGRWERLEIVGVAISPEFVVEYAGSGLFVDNRRYGIVWASSELVGNAFDMKGAFNDVVIRLASATAEARVRSDLDALLQPWGGAPSFGRKDQPAARVLEDEFSQLRTNATIFPLFFLFVAAFLLNVVLSRLVASQREEIAALKAFGYTDRRDRLALPRLRHRGGGARGGRGHPRRGLDGRALQPSLQDYFRFPSIPSVIDWGAVGVGVGVSGGFALLGALSGVRRVMRLTPAEALRPEAPERFRRLTLEALGLGRFMSPAARMVLRNVERRPVRTASTAVGVALAVALLASGRFPYDALDRLMEVEFHLAQRYDALAVFTQATPADAALVLRHVDGVLAAEPFRATAFASRAERPCGPPRSPASAGRPLYRLVDADGRESISACRRRASPGGSRDYLGVAVGDTIARRSARAGKPTRRSRRRGDVRPDGGAGHLHEPRRAEPPAARTGLGIRLISRRSRRGRESDVMRNSRHSGRRRRRCRGRRQSTA